MYAVRITSCVSSPCASDQHRLFLSVYVPLSPFKEFCTQISSCHVSICLSSHIITTPEHVRTRQKVLHYDETRRHAISAFTITLVVPWCQHPFGVTKLCCLEQASYWPTTLVLGRYINEQVPQARLYLLFAFLSPADNSSLLPEHRTKVQSWYLRTSIDMPTPRKAPVIDVSQNPFLNQVSDDPLPWQDVKKRGASSVEAPAPKSRTLVIKDANKAIPHRTSDTQTRTRATSTTTTTSDRSYDPHENWCGVCNIKFSSKSALQNHAKQMPDHKHYCNLCVRVFKDRNGLKNHVDNSWGHETSCNLCLSAFKDEWGLKNHFENNYHVDHRFVCLTCLLGFQSQMDLERHLKTAKKHTWCMTCRRPFSSQDERDKHWRTTTSECLVLAIDLVFMFANMVSQRINIVYKLVVTSTDRMLPLWKRTTNAITSDATVAGASSRARPNCFNTKKTAVCQSNAHNALSPAQVKEGLFVTCNSASRAMNVASIPPTKATCAS
jgi:hypothetical protein